MIGKKNKQTRRVRWGENFLVNHLVFPKQNPFCCRGKRLLFQPLFPFFAYILLFYCESSIWTALKEETYYVNNYPKKFRPKQDLHSWSMWHWNCALSSELWCHLATADTTYSGMQHWNSIVMMFHDYEFCDCLNCTHNFQFHCHLYYMLMTWIDSITC